MFEHPQVIHFPIALLSVAVFTELCSYFIAKDFLRKTTLLLVSIGVVTAFIAVQTGETDAEKVKSIQEIQYLLNQHESAGEWVLRIFGFTLLLKWALILSKKNWASVRIIITFFMLAGFLKLYEAGNFGGILVFEKGVGVQNIPAADSTNLKIEND